MQVGRLQIFNNWSPWLVASEDKVWVGLEYFCNDTDALWKLFRRGDEAVCRSRRYAKIGILKAEDVEDCARRPRTQEPIRPTSAVTTALTLSGTTSISFENLFLVGRNGMHKYNNQDHSMLTAMTAVENIVRGVATKENIWAINTEMEYHEEKHDQQADPLPNPVVAHA